MLISYRYCFQLGGVKLEKFTKDFVKSDFLKSQNLSFFKSHLRVFGTMIAKKIFFWCLLVVAVPFSGKS